MKMLFENEKKTKAFTLAEVLITLTIIGVIAALTIPNLMQSYKKHQIETGLKSAYSILQNVISMAQAEHGSLQEMIDACSTGTYDEKANCFTNNYLKPYLKYSHSCEQYEKNCKPVFPTDKVKKLDGTEAVSSELAPNSQMATIGLNNGILVGVIWWDYVAPSILLDVNGWKGPNQLGVDTFYFTLHTTASGIGTSTADGLRCGRLNYEPTAYYWTHSCNGEGDSCSCPIMYNGWKIPDDYPVKKF